TYDGFGNRTSVKVVENGKETKSIAATFNDGNQLVKFGNESLTYDANGNRTSDGKYKYTWNEDDQIVAITKQGESNAFATYKYDEDNRRIEKSVNGQVTRYFYDGDSINPLYETDGSGNVIRQYVYSVNGLRLAMKSQGQTLYYHYNPRGDVVAMTNQDKEVVATYEYDSWGNVLKSDVKGVAADNPFGYAGYMYDKEIGMYYLIARYYNPEHGVFLSVDPDPGDSDDPVTMNGYTYADNNPVMNIDPDGHWAMAAGIYFVPGLGQAALLATIAVGGAYAAWRIGAKIRVMQARSKPSGPDPKAKGSPHTRYKTKNGKVTEYATYGQGGVLRKQFRGEGKPHGDVPRPNVKTKNQYNRNPITKKKYPKEKVRKPFKKEYPRGY
ncbi:RHS repeat-associated core domain-containing protein, partial [Bacillus paranthracis]